MKYRCLCILFVTLLAFTKTIAQGVSFSITGNTFLKEGIARLYTITPQNNLEIFDSATIQEGKFYIADSLVEPSLFVLQIGNEERNIFIGNEHITVTETDSVSKKITISGSSLTNDYDAYTARFVTPQNKRLPVQNEYQYKVAEKQQQINIYNTHLPDSSTTFIREHPASFVSVYLLAQFANSYNSILLHSLYNLLNTDVKNYPTAVFIKNKIDFSLHQSARCPSFSVPDSANQRITLESFIGNYVLIDFWASWCAPCIKEMPQIRSAALQWSHRNFKVFTASLDSDEQSWRRALNTYHLYELGKHVLLKNTFTNDMAVQFGVRFIPSNILVDPEGNIIGRNLTGAELALRLSQLFKSGGTE